VQGTIWAESLRAAGIRCVLRNTTLSGAIGEIPFLECAPQLWIERDTDEARALRDPSSTATSGTWPQWRCEHCGELSGSAVRRLLAMRSRSSELGEPARERQQQAAGRATAAAPATQGRPPHVPAAGRGSASPAPSLPTSSKYRAASVSDMESQAQRTTCRRQHQRARVPAPGRRFPRGDPTPDASSKSRLRKSPTIA